jgi:hypothetical protein
MHAPEPPDLVASEHIAIEAGLEAPNPVIVASVLPGHLIPGPREINMPLRFRIGEDCDADFIFGLVCGHSVAPKAQGVPDV